MDFLARVWTLLELTAARALGAQGFQLAMALSILLILLDFVRRGFRFVWPAGKVRSVLATLAILDLNLLFGPYVSLLADGLQAAYDALGIPKIDTGFWTGVSPWVLVPLAVVVYDLANYWNHRVMHMRWLWPVHAVHHSDPDMTGMTTYRVHIFEPLVMMTSYTLLLSWLGFPPGVLGGAAVLVGLHNFYVHIDVDWGHGPFRKVVASPRFHRWHHADTPEAHGKNLANVFPFLDVIFGTYYVPGTCNVALGAKGVPQHDIVQLMLWPITQWTLMLRRRLRKRLAAAPRPDGQLSEA